MLSERSKRSNYLELLLEQTLLSSGLGPVGLGPLWKVVQLLQLSFHSSLEYTILIGVDRKRTNENDSERGKQAGDNESELVMTRKRVREQYHTSELIGFISNLYKFCCCCYKRMDFC